MSCSRGPGPAPPSPCEGPHTIDQRTTHLDPWPAPEATRLRQRFLDQGYVHVESVLSPDLVTALVEAFDDFAAGLGTPPAGSNPYPHGLIQFEARQKLPVLDRTIRGELLPALAMAVLGREEAVLFQDHMVWKVPGSGPVSWHQDYGYWPLERPGGAMMWVGLDDALPDNGGMHYLPGSHRWGEFQPTDFVAGSNQPELAGRPPMDIEPHLDQVVAVTTRPGDVLMHHCLTWHSSSPNLTTQHRRAFIMSWIPPDIGWDTAHAPHPYNHTLNPVRGTALEGEKFPRFRVR